MKLLSHHVIRDHVVIGGIFALSLLPVFGLFGSAAFWLATVLIDIDHYFKFLRLTQFKVFDVRRMQRFFEVMFQNRAHPDFIAVEVFHTLEFLLFFSVITIWIFPILLPVWLGIFFHMLVDFVHLFRYKALTKRCHSFIEYWWRRRKILREGRNPNAVVANALLEAGLSSKF